MVLHVTCEVMSVHPIIIGIHAEMVFRLWTTEMVAMGAGPRTQTTEMVAMGAGPRTQTTEMVAMSAGPRTQTTEMVAMGAGPRTYTDYRNGGHGCWPTYVHRLQKWWPWVLAHVHRLQKWWPWVLAHVHRLLKRGGCTIQEWLACP